MALWRDPLDELIDDLERTLPREKSTDVAEIQRALESSNGPSACSCGGSEEERARVMHTQRFHDALALKGWPSFRHPAR